MNNKLLEDIKSSKSITIIGVSVIATSKFRADLKNSLFSDLEKGKKKCNVISESDNQLFQQSLLTDTDDARERISFEELIIRRKFLIGEFDKTEERKNNSNVRLSALTLPFYAIQTDKSLWYLPINDFNADNYFILEENDKLYVSVKTYINLLTDGLSIKDREYKFLSKPDVELLELFDQNKAPRGIFPRDSFYNTDHYQYVVWGLVFSREGKLLIHQRAKNAKDNQGMWDKSVGGHLDFKLEKSTHEAMVRELIEELFTKEQIEQQGHGFSMLTDDIESVYFLGDWRLEDYGPYYLDHIELLESKKKKGTENWVMYKYPKTFTHNTPRRLPNGKERRLRVMVDVFFIITNTTITDTYLEKFENSSFLLVEPNKLKSWVDNEVDDDNREFKVTPDLKYIMTGKLRDVITEVSTTIKYSNIRK
ncbi:MAG: NUDIX domain-containing protein [Tannerella sp.]|jgi:hypothetical protein|nr:NUDIX domain-containing protein [Tannerella sp.]